MNGMESTSAAHLVKMTQPEEFDLVILGDGTGSTVAPPGSIAHFGTTPIRDCCRSIDPLILFVVLLADRVFSCRHGLADGLSDFFVV
jgi:hypothetical protein